MYGGLIQLPYILASVVGGCSQNPVLLVEAAPQLRWAVFRDGVGVSKQVLNPQFWHHTQSSSLPVVLSTRSYPTHA